MIKEINENAPELSAKMKLYASDEVFNLYYQLSQFGKYAFTQSIGQSRLTEDGKGIFSMYTTILARMMQEDMGYREYIGNPETVICPNCGREHDAYKTCKCGMTVPKTLEKLGEGLRLVWEENQKSQNDSR